jgi:hypothetical protein
MILDHWHGQGVGDTSFACRAEDEDFQKGWDVSRECGDYADALFCAAEAQSWTWFVDSGWRAVQRLKRTWSRSEGAGTAI